MMHPALHSLTVWANCFYLLSPRALPPVSRWNCPIAYKPSSQLVDRFFEAEVGATEAGAGADTGAGTTSERGTGNKGKKNKGRHGGEKMGADEGNAAANAFLRDFILNKRWVDQSEAPGYVPSYREVSGCCGRSCVGKGCATVWSWVCVAGKRALAEWNARTIRVLCGE
jgi:hypothetical protein